MLDDDCDDIDDDDDGINYHHRYIDITAVSLSPLTIISLPSFIHFIHINSLILSLIFYQQHLYRILS